MRYVASALIAIGVVMVAKAEVQGIPWISIAGCVVLGFGVNAAIDAAGRRGRDK